MAATTWSVGHLNLRVICTALDPGRFHIHSTSVRYPPVLRPSNLPCLVNLGTYNPSRSAVRGLENPIRKRILVSLYHSFLITARAEWLPLLGKR
jgi:hypothetical protein